MKILRSFKSWLKADTVKSESEELMQRRRLLADEQRQLNESLERTLSAYGDRVSALSNRIRELDATSRPQELMQIRQMQDELKCVLRRLDVAERTTRELIDEWHDWETFGQTSGCAEHNEKVRRQEFLRSELSLRGVELKKNSKQIEPSQAVPIKHEVVDVVDSLSRQETECADDELPEWDEMVVQEAETPRFGMILDKDLDEKMLLHLAEQASELKTKQATLKLYDRMHGIRRYRLTVFK